MTNPPSLLRLSGEAATLIRGLQRTARSTAGSGLRITVDRRFGSLSMALASAPAPGDTIIGKDAVLVFLSAEASARLRGKTLVGSEQPQRPSFHVV